MVLILAIQKINQMVLLSEIYLNKLIERTKETNHIKSFKNFIDFCYELRGEIQST
jgi:hypothetical protein